MAELDAAQQAAVDAGPVDAFIAAGAGAGKTRVLVSRFVHAVLGVAPYEPCDPAQLLTVTYTEKAAGELAERIRRELGRADRHDAARRIGEAWISTIHGMCARILRQYAFDAGIDPRFGILDAAEAAALETEALEGAVRELLACDSQAIGLFDEFGFDVVSAAVRDARASTRALALDIDAIKVAAPTDALDTLSGIVPKLRDVASALDGLRQTATVSTSSVSARRVAEAIEAALQAPSATATATILEGLSAHGIRSHASVEGLADLTTEARSLIEEARRCAAQLAVAPQETTLLALAARFAQSYEEMKRARGVLDFEDLQVMTACLLESRPDVAAEVRARFAMVMVDEFQDANALQLKIVESLSSNNLCTVGDENQSIYAFRHADVEVFLSRALSTERHHTLGVNYRSDPSLVAAVAGIFSQPALLGASLEARPPEDAPPSPGTIPVELRFLDLTAFAGDKRTAAEAACIADRVVELTERGFAPGEIAVLLQRCAGGRAVGVGRALEARGVPVVLASGGGFFECAEVAEVRALLQVIDNVLDDAALVTLLAGRFGGLSADALFALRQRADSRSGHLGLSRRDTHLWDALPDAAGDLAPEDAAALARICSTVEATRRRRGARSLEATILDALAGLNAELVYASAGSGGTKAWMNVLKLARMARDYEHAVGGGIAGFLEHLRARAEYSAAEQEATLDEEDHAVRVMSIHGSKGLEFPAVIVGGLGRPRSPGRIAFARVGGLPLLGIKPTWDGAVTESLGWKTATDARAAGDAAEIRRLLYVACTRARNDLTVCATVDPEKEADDTPAGLFRRAVGAADAGGVCDAICTVGDGQARVSLITPDAESAAPVALPETCVKDWGTAVVGERAVAGDSADSENDARSRGPELQAYAATHPPTRVSYSGLSVYESCPYRYYLTAIARVGSVRTERGRQTRAFGTAVHAVLELCNQAGADVPEVAKRVAVAAGLDAAQGTRLESAVTAFLTSDTADRALSSSSVLREAPFAVPVAGTMLVGSIDLLALDNDRALVVDYKTGNRPLAADEARQRYRLQGQCYALAAMAAGGSRVRVVFAELERGREIVFEYGLDDRAGIETAIAGIVSGISAHEFRPRSTYESGLCDSCPGLGGMCSVTRPGPGAAG